MRTAIALFHKDKYFTNAFFPLVSEKYKRKFEIISFSCEENILKYINENTNKNIYVISEYEFLRLIDSNNINKIATSNYSDFTNKGKIYFLNIYQSGDDIMTDIEKIVLSLNPDKVNMELNSKNNISSFFSSQGGSGVSTIAYMTAAELSKLGKTLYLNLEQLGYTDKLYTNTCSGNIYDIIVSASSKTNCSQNIITLASKNSHGVYILPKFQSMGELYTLNMDNYSFLIDNICDCGYFDYVIIDTIHGINKINEMTFSKCNNVFAVYTADSLGLGKMNNLNNDPFVKRFDFYDKIKFILNKCEKKVTDEMYVAVFPFSQSTHDGTDITAILNKNADISSGIEKIKKIISR